jgi:hypothetical protein
MMYVPTGKEVVFASVPVYISSAMVPLLVIVPPERPVPAVMEVTPPDTVAQV